VFRVLRRPLAFVALAVLAAGAEARAQLPAITLPPELDRVLRDYEDAWEAGDEDRLASLFTEDGFVLSNGRPPVRGREAIAETYGDAAGPLTLAALAFATGDTVGYIVGTYGGPDPATHRGKFILALRKGPAGEWLIAGDIDNLNQR
jgi:ketosteroid isomerase-like protein